jgi:hypothetical protein
LPGKHELIKSLYGKLRHCRERKAGVDDLEREDRDGLSTTMMFTVSRIGLIIG